MSYASERHDAPHSNYYNELIGQPDLNKIVDILEWTLTKFGQQKSINPTSKLTRIHFHCLIFHIIAEVIDDGDVKKKKTTWSNTKSSLMSGSKIAAKQACGVEFEDESENRNLEKLLDFRFLSKDDNFTIHINSEDGKGSTQLKFNSTHPVIEFTRGCVKFALTPVLMCKNPVKTVGLGDAISANGLLYSNF